MRTATGRRQVRICGRRLVEEPGNLEHLVLFLFVIHPTTICRLLRPLPTGPRATSTGQLLSNVTCTTCTSSKLSRFPMAAVELQHAVALLTHSRWAGGADEDVCHQLSLSFLGIARAAPRRRLLRGGGRWVDGYDVQRVVTALCHVGRGGSDGLISEGEGRKRDVFDMRRKATQDCEDEERPDAPIGGG
ncbi:hypothetical protein EDB89DRAFT_1996322 [Lactarius sanguifluus]|nr:hypothetical protein EDB89DRAFT_1996322 [Lactarius sanguifluus]